MPQQPFLLPALEGRDLSSLPGDNQAPLLRICPDAANGLSVPIKRLFDRDELPAVAARALEIRRPATGNLVEREFDTLHLLLGFATGGPDYEGRLPTAPVLLMPVASRRRVDLGRRCLDGRRCGSG